MTIENKKKTEAIKNALVELVSDLQWKINEFNEIVTLAADGYPIPFYIDIDPIVKYVKILTKFKFESVC